MKWKIISADFNKDTGISYVKIDTDLGVFEGKSILHKEDEDIVSNFEGCRYAELRAVTKYIKAKIRNQKIKVETLNNLIINMEHLYNYAKNTPEARFTRKQYYLELKKLKDLKDILKRLQNRILEDMKGYRELHTKAMEKMNKKHSYEN